MRRYCEKCRYPQTTCICSHISIINTSLNIIIVQHEKEALHAKNTARLISLCVPHTEIVCANDSVAMQGLLERCSIEHSALIYPSDVSHPIEAIAPTTASTISTIVLIDGSWKQAFGIVKKNPWLEKLRAFHFASAPSSNYFIRHTSLDNALSTLEATAYALHCIDKVDVSALHKAQSALQSVWQGPTSHRRKV
ncbi:tRNA-uridine aminocarboxypropyltransferase [Alteromonas gracilis]|uniref:tRNA-uridine aminocarboxypropyltransferase n=1 Tax=Alteromonas gracilis TaxID=1479524 RepID=UPI0037363DB4